ncbi:MFS transporter [Brevibacillus sp. SYP-B805]|uniref:MDR family MFS transporter n=1 Tax=Brevibacillus sp. SYP-B805 TaxID=1578199 RepID=UPI0013ECC18C|nr:MFS transporter [Brevibacillus sp. SYP-B805]NGQ95958.1 MFS transporter [Brevibacillus sp. SYP-B805]
MKRISEAVQRLKTWYVRYDTAIWVRVWGTVLTSMTGFMLRPFLVLYLYDKLGGSILLPMVVVGLQPFTGMIVGLMGGGLSDRYGRKPVMLVALAIQTLSMLGFVFAETVWHFALLTVMNGLGGSLFFPAANAQVSDVVPEDRRAEVFALLHTALNVGAAAGPLMGLVLFTQNPALVFSSASLAFLCYGAMLWWKVPETLPVDGGGPTRRTDAPKLELREHRRLLWITILAVPVSMLYAQVETVLPLHLKSRFADYQTIFAWLMTINGTTVILLQMWLAKRTEHLSSHKVILAAYLILVAVACGYAFAPAFAVLVAVEMLFTVGEMLVGPHMQKAISLMAPPEMRGRYFSIYGMNWQISRAVGPLLGGAAFTRLGGVGSFLLVALTLLVAGFFQYRMVQAAADKQANSVKASAVTG